jgi:hypothetical protein
MAQQPTDVSPGQLVQSGQPFTDVKESFDNFKANLHYRIDAYNQPWGQDTPGLQYQNDVMDPTMNSTDMVLDGGGDAAEATGDMVTTTGLIYQGSNVAAGDNVQSLPAPPVELA